MFARHIWRYVHVLRDLRKVLVPRFAKVRSRRTVTALPGVVDFFLTVFLTVFLAATVPFFFFNFPPFFTPVVLLVCCFLSAAAP